MYFECPNVTKSAFIPSTTLEMSLIFSMFFKFYIVASAWSLSTCRKKVIVDKIVDGRPVDNSPILGTGFWFVRICILYMIVCMINNSSQDLIQNKHLLWTFRQKLADVANYCVSKCLSKISTYLHSKCLFWITSWELLFIILLYRSWWIYLLIVSNCKWNGSWKSSQLNLICFPFKGGILLKQ